MSAPVQVLVLGFAEPRFTGEALAELARLGDAGIVALLDLLVVTRTPEGLEVLDVRADVRRGADVPAGAAALALLGAADGAADETAGAGPVWSLDTVPVGTTAAVAFLEHRWAGPLTEAIARAGGSALEETWLAPADADRLRALLAAPDDGS